MERDAFLTRRQLTNAPAEPERAADAAAAATSASAASLSVKSVIGFSVAGIICGAAMIYVATSGLLGPGLKGNSPRAVPHRPADSSGKLVVPPAVSPTKPTNPSAPIYRPQGEVDETVASSAIIHD